MKLPRLWPRSRPPPRAPDDDVAGHQEAMAELGRKDDEIEGLISTGDSQVMTLLGRVDRFAAEVSAVITGRGEGGEQQLCSTTG